MQTRRWCSHTNGNGNVQGVFFSTWPITSGRYRLLYLPDTRRTTRRWYSVGRSVRPALIGQAGGGGTPYTWWHLTTVLRRSEFVNPYKLLDKFAFPFRSPHTWSARVGGLTALWSTRLKTKQCKTASVKTVNSIAPHSNGSCVIVVANLLSVSINMTQNNEEFLLQVSREIH